MSFHVQGCLEIARPKKYWHVYELPSLAKPEQPPTLAWGGTAVQTHTGQPQGQPQAALGGTATATAFASGEAGAAQAGAAAGRRGTPAS